MNKSKPLKLKLTRKEALLFVPVAVLLLYGSPWSDDIRGALNWSGDKMERVSRQLSGWGAKDCGRHSISDTSKDVGTDACAIAAFKAREPFRVRYDYEANTQTAGSISLAGNSAGKIYILRTDEFNRNQFDRIKITNPKVEISGGREVLTSESPVLERSH